MFKCLIKAESRFYAKTSNPPYFYYTVTIIKKNGEFFWKLIRLSHTEKQVISPDSINLFLKENKLPIIDLTDSGRLWITRGSYDYFPFDEKDLELLCYYEKID